MAINASGVSVVGLQTLGVTSVPNPYSVVLDVSLVPANDIKRRLGFLILAQVLPTGFIRVIDTKKIFSSGQYFVPPFPEPGILIGVLVDWYHPDVPWQLQTFDL